MAYYDGDFEQFLEDRLKRCKVARFSNSCARPRPMTGKNKSFRFNRRMGWLVVAYLVVVGMLFSSVGTAYAAIDSLPNEPLYAVKLAGEDLQLLLTSDSYARISLLTTFTNRRAVEATILASQGQPVPEPVSALIDEYQDEIMTLTVTLDDDVVPIPIIGIQKRPQDQVNFSGSNGKTESKDDDPKWELNGENAVEQPGKEDPGNDDPANPTAELSIIDLTTTKTGTNGNSGKMNTTQTGSGSRSSSGQGKRQDYSSSDVVTFGQGLNHGSGNSSDVPQQLTAKNPQMGNEGLNQPTENKGNKP